MRTNVLAHRLTDEALSSLARGPSRTPGHSGEEEPLKNRSPNSAAPRLQLQGDAGISALVLGDFYAPETDQNNTYCLVQSYLLKFFPRVMEVPPFQGQGRDISQTAAGSYYRHLPRTNNRNVHRELQHSLVY